MSRSQPIIRTLNGRRVHISITEGECYEIQPADSSRAAQAGRICRIEALEAVPVPRRARVRFEDNGRIGIVPLRDLIALSLT
jgi:hypothetical protein